MQDLVGQAATLQAGVDVSGMDASGMDTSGQAGLNLKQLQKENRILKKKLERFESDHIRLEELNRNKERLLKQVIVELQASQGVLERKSNDLEEALAALHQTQAQLIESEKLAALGRLVAGVAHEINTPLGTAVTVASTLADETRLFQRAIAQGSLKRSLLNHYTEIASEGTQLILSNLARAAELVHSFKQIAVDQAQSELRFFDVRAYLEEVMLSLSPQLRQTSHSWCITGDENLVIQSYPGLLAQILTNLVTNSLLHGYEPGEAGKLSLYMALEAGQLLLIYRDDGRGIPPADQPRIFEPFFTTARDRGGTGLGLSILYNLVVQNLKGEVMLQSQPGKGVQFKILLPLEQNKIEGQRKNLAA